jgi:hypothetical protein
MTRKEINEILSIPLSNLSDWSKKEDDVWRKLLYTLLKNIPKDDAIKYVQMGDIENMTIEEMDAKIHLYMEVEDTK